MSPKGLLQFQPAASGLGFSRKVILRAVILVLGLAGWSATGQAAAVVVSGNSAVNMTSDDGPRNVTVGFFDDANGERVGRLQIGLMTLGYRHQGVFRVAWKPQVTLTGVTLQLNDSAAGKTVGAQMPEAFRSIGAAGSLLLRAVVLEIQQPTPVRIVAHGAEFTPTGDLLLLQARRSDESSEVVQNFMLHLNGAKAGTIDSLPANPLSTLNTSQSVTLSKP